MPLGRGGVRVLPDGSLAGSPELLLDHALIVEEAVAALRDRYAVRGRFVGVQADPDGFLGEERFTLHQLRLVHEAVLGERMHKDNFNRRVKDLVDPVLDAEGGRSCPMAFAAACGALSPGLLGDTPGGSTTRCRWVAQPASCGSAGTIPGWADEVREVVGEPVALAPSNSPLRLAPSAPRTQGCFE